MNDAPTHAHATRSPAPYVPFSLKYRQQRLRTIISHNRRHGDWSSAAHSANIAACFIGLGLKPLKHTAHVKQNSASPLPIIGLTTCVSKTRQIWQAVVSTCTWIILIILGKQHQQTLNKNLAIAKRSRVCCAHDTLRASTPCPNKKGPTLFWQI